MEVTGFSMVYDSYQKKLYSKNVDEWMQELRNDADPDIVINVGWTKRMKVEFNRVKLRSRGV